MKIPQFLPWVGQEEYESIGPCFDANWITEGPKSQEFVRQLLELTGARYGVLAPNGTLALYLALKAAGIQPGDEVIVPDFTFIATANAVEMVGAIPVFADVNRKNFQIDLDAAAKVLTPKTKGIMPVHVYGTAANMEHVMAFAQQHHLLVIEDAAQAIGVHYKGQHAGTFGKTGAFSFFADKTITTGEGGMVVTNDASVYEHLLYLRNQGRKERGSFIHPEIGYNFRMTDIQSAMGLTQLKKLDEIIRRKKVVKELYLEHLRDIPALSFFEPEPGADWIPFRMGILCKEAHQLMAFLTEKGIEPRTFFYPLHRQPCYQQTQYTDAHFLNATFAYEQGICLPTYPTLGESEIVYISSMIKSFYERF
jgi:perosamine synthetase